MAKLTRLLSEAEISPVISVLNRIEQSSHFSSRVLVLSTAENARVLYNQACMEPQSITRGYILEHHGVSLGRNVTMHGGNSQTMFFYAFRRDKPMLLKIPEFFRAD